MKTDWWEGNDYWHQKTEDDCHSPSDWGFMEQMALQSIHDREKVGGLAQSYIGVSDQWPEEFANDHFNNLEKAWKTVIRTFWRKKDE